MTIWRAHTQWRTLRCNVLRASEQLECRLSVRVQQNLGRSRTRSYWGCVLNRTHVPAVVRGETCHLTVRHFWSATSVGTARLSLVFRILAVPAGISAYNCLVGVAPLTRAYCKRRVVPSRLPPPRRSHDPELQFDWFKFWEFLAPDLVLLVLAIACAVLAAILNISIPLELGRVVNTIAFSEENRGENWDEVGDYLRRMMLSGVRLGGMYLTQSVFTFFYITLLSFMGERLAVRLRTALFRSLVEQDIAFFDAHKSGELISRLSGDIQDFKSSFKMAVSQGLRSLTQTLGCVVSLYLISPQMTAVVGVALPVMIAVGTTFGAVLRQWSRQAQEQVAIATGVANEALSNVRTVRAFAMEEKETSLFSQELKKACWLNERLGTGIAFFQALSNLAINGIVMAVLSHGGFLLMTNKISVGDLMSFLVATQTIQRSMGNLSILFGQIVRGTSAGARVFEYMTLQPSIPLRGGATIPPNQIEGRVEFKNVKFAYPTRPEQVVLEDLMLELPPGKVTALCGLSGAGKSTVAALLERFFDPQEGAILLDGHPLSSLDPSWVRGELAGYIHQEPVLFATSVMENIRYGRPSATDEEVYEASRLANADGFICQFPDGYSTLVGERGHAVSGGQKQRIAIARALLKNPRVLILDEATSALDAQSERLVQEALDRACQGRTVLIIAHRLSTIQGADQIAVLHHGKLRELGTHAALLAKGGIYAELIRRQTVVP